MLNQVIIVGRLTNDIAITKTEDGKKLTRITLACTRPYKNADGIYETDFVDCTLWEGIAEKTIEYCHKGDVIGVRGRIQSKMEDNARILEIIAEKITFLSSKKQEEGDTPSA